MKFGKNLLRIVEMNDAEWGPYWINYKTLKKKINDIVEEQSRMASTTTTTTLARTTATASASASEATAPSSSSLSCSVEGDVGDLTKSECERDFFRMLRSEVKKVCEFFDSSEQIYRIRQERVQGAFEMLKSGGHGADKAAWSRLLAACSKFYKDMLYLENFAIMNYCGFSKILKKHDKLTGFATREAFLRNIMAQQNIAQYPNTRELLFKSEKLFDAIQGMESVVPLKEEERLFIEAMLDLNQQASHMQREESYPQPAGASIGHRDSVFASGGGIGGEKSGRGEPSTAEKVDLATSAVVLAAHLLETNVTSSTIANPENNLSWMKAIVAQSSTDGYKKRSRGDDSDDSDDRSSNDTTEGESVVDTMVATKRRTCMNPRSKTPPSGVDE